MFTIYVHKTLDDHTWSIYGVYDIDNHPSDLFDRLDANYPCDWYARPDTYKAECWLSERGII